MPEGRKATYAEFIANIRPQKEEIHRVCLTAGNNLIQYPWTIRTPTVNTTTTKLLLKSVVSTPGANFTTSDINDFYLNTPIEQYKYMHIHINMTPQDIINAYNLLPLAKNYHVLVDTHKGMYGLPQAGKITDGRLVKHLANFGYFPDRHMPGMWHHNTLNIRFCLVVDDYGTKYVNKADVENLNTALSSLYKIISYWRGGLYLGLTLKWDYEARTCNVFMPGYI